MRRAHVGELIAVGEWASYFGAQEVCDAVKETLVGKFQNSTDFAGVPGAMSFRTIIKALHSQTHEFHVALASFSDWLQPKLKRMDVSVTDEEWLTAYRSLVKADCAANLTRALKAIADNEEKESFKKALMSYFRLTTILFKDYGKYYDQLCKADVVSDLMLEDKTSCLDILTFDKDTDASALGEDLETMLDTASLDGVRVLHFLRAHSEDSCRQQVEGFLRQLEVALLGDHSLTYRYQVPIPQQGIAVFSQSSSTKYTASAEPAPSQLNESRYALEVSDLTAPLSCTPIPLRAPPPTPQQTQPFDSVQSPMAADIAARLLAEGRMAADHAAYVTPQGQLHLPSAASGRAPSPSPLKRGPPKTRGTTGAKVCPAEMSTQAGGLVLTYDYSGVKLTGDTCTEVTATRTAESDEEGAVVGRVGRSGMTVAGDGGKELQMKPADKGNEAVLEELGVDQGYDQEKEMQTYWMAEEPEWTDAATEEPEMKVEEEEELGSVWASQSKAAAAEGEESTAEMRRMSARLGQIEANPAREVNPQDEYASLTPRERVALMNRADERLQARLAEERAKQGADSEEARLAKETLMAKRPKLVDCRQVRRAWTEKEEKALMKGVSVYGVGSWVRIKRDPMLMRDLKHRNNEQLKDKFRNIEIRNGREGTPLHVVRLVSMTHIEPLLYK